MKFNTCLAATARLILAMSITTVAAQTQQQTAPEVATTPANGPSKNARYVIDPTHTFVIYEIGHYGTTTNRGRFSTRDGTVHINDVGDAAAVDITMDMSTVNTGVDLLNRHVQSKDFLNVADFPTARFVATRAKINNAKISEVAGVLTMMGQSVPLTLKASRFNCYMSPMVKRQVCGGDFETTIKRSNWGITWGLNFGFEDDVKLLVQVEAVNVD